MTNIASPGRDVQKNPSANANNFASTKSAPASRSIPETGSKPHAFSRSVAATKKTIEGEKLTLGESAAIVLKYLAHRCRRHGKYIDGKKWVRVDLDHIKGKYPYLGRSTVDDNIARLKAFGCIKVGDFNAEQGRPGFDRTRWYHVPEKWMNKAEEEPRYFDPTLAAQVGIPAAVIHFNFCELLSERVENGEDCVVHLSIAETTRLQSFSEDTVKRAIKTLKEECMIMQETGKRSRFRQVAGFTKGANPDEKGANPDHKGANPDGKGANPDNYIYCKQLETELETSSKTEASPPFQTPSDVQLQNGAFVHAGHDDTCAPPAARNGGEGSSNPDTHNEDIKDSNIQEPGTQDEDTQDSDTQESDIKDSRIPDSGTQNLDIKDSQHAAPSSGAISRCAFDGISAWPGVESVAELHDINRIFRKQVEVFEHRPTIRDTFLNSVRRITGIFLQQQDLQALDDLFDHAGDEELIAHLLPRYQAFFDTTALDPGSSEALRLYYGAFECIMGAFLWELSGPDPYAHGIPLLIRVTHEIYLPLLNRAELRRKQGIEEEFAQRRIEFASLDAHREQENSLTPAEKMRAFRNAVYARNKVGWIDYKGELVTDQIIMSKNALKKAQELFASVPQATPADLLKVVDGCVRSFLAQPPPNPTEFTRGVSWHSRMGRNVGTMLLYLQTILKQLGLTGSSPFFNPGSFQAGKSRRTSGNINTHA